MKFIFLAVALSCLSFVVTKPLDDVERKCIVKYLSDKKLLDSSFVVDPVLPDNCDKLISAKIIDFYHGIIPVKDHWHEVDYIFQNNEVADVVLKSLLYDEESKEAKDLQETLKQMRKIADLIESWLNHNLNEIFKELQLDTPDSATELCLKNHVTSEILTNYAKTIRFEQLEKYDIKDLECDKLIASFQKRLEVKLLEKLPKLNTEKENICMQNAYVNLNMTPKFSDAFIFSMMEINFAGSQLYDIFCYEVAVFYEMTMECARLGFILKDVPEVRNFYSIVYSKYFEILVKLNANRSLNEILIISNQNHSQCFINPLKSIELGEMYMKMMAAEDNYEVVRYKAMKGLIKTIFRLIKNSCEYLQDYNNKFDGMFGELRSRNEEIKEMMNCSQEFVSEEIVNGITYFNVNMDGQLNDKCEEALGKSERRQNSFNTTPQDFCIFRELKHLNYFKLELKPRILAELGISPQQKAEERIKFNDLMMKRREVYLKCYKEVFNSI